MFLYSTSRLDGVKPFISVLILIAKVLLLALSALHFGVKTNLFRNWKNPIYVMANYAKT